MTKIAFYANHLSERGTGVALYDYARHARAVLGHDSVVFYDRNHAENSAAVIRRFSAAFEVIPCAGFAEADATLVREGCDLVYAIKAGRRDGVVSRHVPTMVHAVFPTSLREVHGSSYAFVSDWLAQWCSGGRVPFVPHIASIGDNDDDMRRALGIGREALVFGCYGGRTSFDIGFVRNQVVPRVLDSLDDVHFIFMNIEPFISHDRVTFMPGTADVAVKTAFINTCDAMLHARLRGETFGIAVAEFSLRGKPVLTYGGSRERAHLAALGDASLTYGDAGELYDLIAGFDPGAASACETYRRLYAPEPVMAQFAEHLIAPALRNGLDGARKGLGVRPWHAARLPLSKLRVAVTGF